MKTFSINKKNILLIAFYTLLINISTQMFYSQLVIYYRYSLGLSEEFIARLDGISSFVLYVVKIFAGRFADLLNNNKIFLIVGAFAVGIIKPLFIFSKTFMQVFCLEIIERISSGIQSSPKDALLINTSEKKQYGFALGISKAAKTLGYLVGGGVSIIVMFLSNNNYNVLFTLALIPAFLAMFCAFCIDEQKNKKFNNFSFFKITKINFQVTLWLIILFLCELTHFSEALTTIFITNYIGTKMAGIVIILTGLSQAIFAYNIGKYFDKAKIKMYIIYGLISTLALVYLLFSIVFINNYIYFSVLIFLLSGLQISLQIVFLSIMNYYIPQNIRGSVLAVYYMILGVSYMFSSFIAGKIYTLFSFNHITFFYSLFLIIVLFCIILCKKNKLIELK